MSAALATHVGADSSSLTNQTHPDISLSLGPNTTFSTPSRALPSSGLNSFRLPSTSPHGTSSTNASSAPLSTPPPVGASSLSIRKRGEEGITPLSSRLSNLLISGRDRDDDVLNASMASVPPEGETDVLDTPGVRRRDAVADSVLRGKRGAAGVGLGNGARPSAGPANKGVTLTLRDQEKHIDNLKKENFAIKLRVHFLEERLAQLAPDHMDAALKQNISLKIEVQQRGMEMKKLRKLVLELERELERLQQGGSASSSSRERELEEKLEERERELHELREALREQRRRQNDRYNEGQQGELLREAEARSEELEEQLESARGLLEENMEEIEWLRDVVEKQQGALSSDAGESFGPSSREHKRLKRKVESLEADNDDLRARLQEHAEILAQKEEEKEDLIDESDALKLEIEDLQRKREVDFAERSQSRVAILEEREEREAVEEDMNALKDRLAAVMIELQQKEDELDMRGKEIEEMVREHQRIVKVVEDEWRGEVEEANGRLEELQDVLAEREAESRDLRINITELETNTNELHSKYEVALAQLESEVDQKEAEVESLSETIQKLGQQIYHLEDENDRIKEESEKVQNDEAAEREHLETLCATLRDKIAVLKSQLQQVTEAYESTSQEIGEYRSKQEELARHVEDLVKSLEFERNSREKVENDLALAERDHELEVRQERRAVEAKENALRNALADLDRAQSLLAQREKDHDAVQSVLRTMEQESKRLGETHTTARFSLQLEVEKMTRDLERAQDDLTRVRRELEEKENRTKEREGAIDKLHAENRELASHLAAQTQARLNVSEKLDSVQATLKGVEKELSSAKARVHDMEGRLAKDQRELLTAETQYRDQLTERNTLLLTIYQYMDRILGVDKTPRKGGQAETKPFTNFSVFHDNLITRLKALSQIQLDFDKRAKETEARFAERFGDMRKQFDQRWRQLDKFEASLKTYSETKAQWRRKFSAKEGEIEGLKATNAELSAQVANTKRPALTDSMELRSLSTRAANAERRLNNAQNQLLATEEKIASMNQRSTVADTKWEARVKEYEARLKAAEERVKKERLGSKERIVELENNLKIHQRQLEIAQKRNLQLGDVLESNKASSVSTSPTL
ncbi:hypothetical protein AX15_000239 [Amanita polypyramis BW_CC]|nr:hypothetical protein AX15_000239 [Amanita polypyramis BW_CC]